MQWRTVILDSDNWAIATSEIKEVLHWCIKDHPWYVIRTFGFESPPDTYPCQLKSLDWKNAEINHFESASGNIRIKSMLMNARIALLTELHYRTQISAENLGIANSTTTIVGLHRYLISMGVLPGDCAEDDSLRFQNRIKLLDDLERIKNTVIESCIKARSKEQFAQTRELMERLLFTNILL